MSERRLVRYQPRGGRRSTSSRPEADDLPVQERASDRLARRARERVTRNERFTREAYANPYSDRYWNTYPRSSWVPFLTGTDDIRRRSLMIGEIAERMGGSSYLSSVDYSQHGMSRTGRENLESMWRHARNGAMRGLREVGFPVEIAKYIADFIVGASAFVFLNNSRYTGMRDPDVELG